RADVLTGESADDEIHVPGKRPWIKRADVVVDRDSGPMFGEDCSAEWVDLAERDGSDADSLAGEGEAADPGKEVEGNHGSCGSLRWAGCSGIGGRSPSIVTGSGTPEIPSRRPIWNASSRADISRGIVSTRMLLGHM